MSGDPPFRLCCGQQHFGPVCPDGLVMSCLCYERFPIDQLNVTADGDTEDVCIPCAEHERQMVAKQRGAT